MKDNSAPFTVDDICRIMVLSGQTGVAIELKIGDAIVKTYPGPRPENRVSHPKPDPKVIEKIAQEAREEDEAREAEDDVYNLALEDPVAFETAMTDTLRSANGKES
jgi:hypothetical protein